MKFIDANAVSGPDSVQRLTHGERNPQMVWIQRVTFRQHGASPEAPSWGDAWLLGAGVLKLIQIAVLII